MKVLLSILIVLSASLVQAQQQTSFTVNFDFNKSEITPATAARLDSFVNSTRSKPVTYTIELYGHCDSIGSNEYNDALSQRRTDAVKQYLAGKGVQSTAIIREQALGKREPLNGNATDYDRFLNRRVEIAVVSKYPEEKKIEVPVEKPIENTIAKIIEDTTTKVGTKFTLRNLNFVGGRHVLLPESMAILQELLDVMVNNPKLGISIEGHVCCIPDKGDGVDLDLGTRNLSEMRAKAVYDYLVEKGIDAGRLSYKGFGHRFPITPYPETSNEEMVNNRRVEIKIISK